MYFTHSFKSIFFIFFLLFQSFIAVGQKKKTNEYPNGVPIVKGVKFCSLNFDLNSKEVENNQGLLSYVVDQRKSGFQLRLDPGYVIKENLAVGVGLLYGYTKDNNIQQSSDGIISENRYLQRQFAIRPYIKNFIPLGKSNKFYVVIPTELQFGYGSSLKETTTDQILTRIYNQSTYLGLEMRPGILAFIVRNFGFEVNVGAFGLTSTFEKGTQTNRPDSRVQQNDLSLKINLLQLSLGFSLYF